MAKNSESNKRGLGRGLDSLIPKIEDNEEKDKSFLTLEDILSDSENYGEEIIEVEEKNKEENKEENKKERESKKEDEEEIKEKNKEQSQKINNEKEELKPKQIVEETVEKERESKKEQDKQKYSNEEKSDIERLIAAQSIKDKINASKEKEIEKSKESEKASDDSSDDFTNETKQELSDYELASIKEVKEIIEKNPRITLWSAKSSAVFRYLRKTRPEFSISKEASELIDESVSRRYPEIWKLFEEL
jgi:hypothetical protein